MYIQYTHIHCRRPFVRDEQCYSVAGKICTGEAPVTRSSINKAQCNVARFNAEAE